MNKKLEKYLNSDYKKVKGWLHRVDGEIIKSILGYQNDVRTEGSIAEIGLHHGKLFIALAMCLKNNEKAYGIDIFDKQEFNLDNSGKGSFFEFKKNLEKFNIPNETLVIDNRQSEIINRLDIIEKVGRIRFFSIDGGHWKDVVSNDLFLAENTLIDGGVIALDDFLRSEWPDVSLGYFSWLNQTNSNLVPFAIGFNKLYLCDKSYVDTYIKLLESSPFLKFFKDKNYNFLGNNIPIFQSYLLPEWSFKRQFQHFIKVNYPNFYVKLRNGIIK
jgi:hypothetical protein